MFEISPDWSETEIVYLLSMLVRSKSRLQGFSNHFYFAQIKLFLLTRKFVVLGTDKTFSNQKATGQRHQKTLFFAQIRWFYSTLYIPIQNLMQT